jgi:DNA invertase Pin-like site-specific DNA recombinase
MNTELIRAAQYVRMSTEHQQYSTENQADVIQEYANKRGFEIVRTFSDAGKSGLRIDGRDGLKELLRVVQSRPVDFTTILVYDVSRWGRFQDADESAYYEYICKQAGITIQYCAEQFENDGSPVSTIVKGVKRAMAGEYSRELSAKVFKGQCKLVELGFRQGGAAGYGLRRLLLDQEGRPKQELRFGEQKSLQTDRVVLVPGPTEERAVVRRIYQLFVHEGRTEREIAEELNSFAISSEWSRPWTRGTVHQVLTNEKYIGNNVYNHISYKLKKKRVRNAPDMWVRRDGAFDALVEAKDFWAANAIILERHRRVTEAELLERLQELVDRHGRISGLLIDETEGMPSSAVFRHRFGSLLRAYELVDYTPDRDFAFLEINRRLRRLLPKVENEVILALEAQGGKVAVDPQTNLVQVNGMFSISLVLARCQPTPTDALRWKVRLDTSLRPDLTLVVRMDSQNQSPLDYYLLPALDFQEARIRMKEDNGLFLDGYRYESLEAFFRLAQMVRVGVAA